MAGFLLIAVGAVLIVAAALAAGYRARRCGLLVAIAGEASIGAGGLAFGAWPLTAVAWVMGAYLAAQWVRAERKARRRRAADC